MSLRSLLGRPLLGLAEALEHLAAPLSLGLVGEKNGLISFLFHKVFVNRGEAEQGDTDPLEAMTLEDYRWLFTYLKKNEFTFVNPNQLSDIEPHGRHVLLTFDDGYFNNQRILPLLEAFEVPAVFFIATNHMNTGRRFWWDVLYQHRRAQGVPVKEIRKEQESYKYLSYQDIDQKIEAAFGAASFSGTADIDRPFTRDELVAFAQSPYVYLGNHTAHHALLPNHNRETVLDEMKLAQKELTELTGNPPSLFSYPNGYYDTQSIAVADEMGFPFAITVDPKKNPLPLPQGPDRLKLGRFCLFGKGQGSLAKQCRKIRAQLGWSAQLIAYGSKGQG